MKFRMVMKVRCLEPGKSNHVGAVCCKPESPSRASARTTNGDGLWLHFDSVLRSASCSGIYSMYMYFGLPIWNLCPQRSRKVALLLGLRLNESYKLVNH